MKKLTILFVLFIAIVAQAEKKLYMTYLTNGPIVSLNVVKLSETLVVQKVITLTLASPGGLTAIQKTSVPGQFFVFYNRQVAGAASTDAAPIKIFRVTVREEPFEFVPNSTKTLAVRSINLLNFSVQNGFCSLQRVRNRIDTCVVNGAGQFQTFKRQSLLPGEPYSTSVTRMNTPTGNHDYSATLFRAGDRFGARFRNHAENVEKTVEFTGDSKPVYEGTLGGYLLRDRLWFFLAGHKTTPTKTQTNYEIREFDPHTFAPIGPATIVDPFRVHGNPDANYFATGDATVYVLPDGDTIRIPAIFDRYNAAKKTNELFGTAFQNVESMKRVVPAKRIAVPISNNSVNYGVDISAID